MKELSYERTPPLLLDEHETFTSFVEACRQTYVQRVSFPAELTIGASEATAGMVLTSGRQAQSAGAVCLRFIFWEHNTRNVQRLLPLLQGCDVLAHELPYVIPAALGSTAESLTSVNVEQLERDLRRSFQELSVLIRSHDTPDQDLDVAANAVLGLRTEADVRRAQLRGGGHSAYKQIYKALKGTIEAVEHLDVTPLMMREYVRSKGLEWAARFLVQHLKNHGGSWSDVCDGIVKERMLTTDTLILREQIDAGQIDGLARRYPSKTIGILCGLGHHLVTRMIETSDVVLQRQFVLADKSTAYKDPRPEAVISDVLRVCNALPVREVHHLVLQELCPGTLQEKLLRLDPKHVNELAVIAAYLMRETINEDEAGGIEKIANRERDVEALFNSFINEKSRP